MDVLLRWKKFKSSLTRLPGRERLVSMVTCNSSSLPVIRHVSSSFSQAQNQNSTTWQAIIKTHFVLQPISQRLISLLTDNFDNTEQTKHCHQGRIGQGRSYMESSNCSLGSIFLPLFVTVIVYIPVMQWEATMTARSAWSTEPVNLQRSN